jgi:hypothetical protein
MSQSEIHPRSRLKTVGSIWPNRPIHGLSNRFNEP